MRSNKESKQAIPRLSGIAAITDEHMKHKKSIPVRPQVIPTSLHLHQRKRHLQSTDISEIPLAQPWPLKSTSLLDIFDAFHLTELKPIYIPVFYFSYLTSL